MRTSPAAAVLVAAMTVFACGETAAAKTARPRHPAALQSSSGQVAQRTKPPASHAPTQDQKAWMDRASAPSNSGGGGGGM
jgi:hypothetical protein